MRCRILSKYRKFLTAALIAAFICHPAGKTSVYGQTGADAAGEESAAGSGHESPNIKNGSPRSDVKTGRRRIAVIPFANLTGSSDYNLWSESIPAAITTSMQERFEFTSIKGPYPGMAGKPAGWQPNAEELAAMGRRLGAHIILSGSYTLNPEGGSLSVTTLVYHVQLDELLPPFEVLIKTDSSMFASLSDEAHRISSGIRIPSPPAELTASKGLSTEKIELTWKLSAGAAGYRIYRFDAEDSEPSEIGEAESPSFTDAISAPGRTYTYRVRAYSKYGMSRYSRPDSGYLKVKPPVIKAQEGGRDSVKITWDAVEGAAGYDIFRAESKDGAYEKAGSSSSPGFYDKPGKTGFRYWYRGQSLSDQGPGGLSGEVSGYLAKPMLPFYLRGIVPGWGQIYAGSRYKGWAVAGAFSAASLGGIYYGINYYQSKNEYDSMGASSSRREFDKVYDEYNHNAFMTNIFLSAAALVYVYNWIDLIFFTGSDYRYVASSSRAAGSAELCFQVRGAEDKGGPVMNAGVTWSY